MAGSDDAASSAVDLEAYRAALLAAQRMTPVELAELRAGRMGPAGQRAIDAGIARQRVLVMAGALVVVVGLAFGFVFARIDPAHALRVGGVAVSWTALTGLAGVLFCVLGLRGATVLRGERTAAPVTLDGPIDPIIPGLDRNTPKRVLMVGGAYFSSGGDPIILAVFDQLVARSTLRLYLTPRRRLIVAVEPLPPS